MTHARLAVHARLGDHRQAIGDCERALALLDDVDDPKAGGVRASLDELVRAELDPDGPRAGRRRRQSGRADRRRGRPGPPPPGRPTARSAGTPRQNRSRRQPVNYLSWPAVRPDCT
ncbi:hypothetical protein [Micromonospora rubida]